MENLISGLLNTAIDAISSVNSSSSSGHGDSSSVDRSTWAQIAAGQDEHKSNYGQGQENAGHHSRPDRYHKVPEEQWQGYRRPSHKQEYAKPVTSDVDIEPTEEELGNISAACNRLWGLDLNRLSPGRDYEIDCGEGKRVGDQQDRADNTFFSYVNEDVFRRPTFARFYALLDNYSAKQGVREHVSDEKKQEENAFIEEISRTAPIQYLFKYLVAQSVIPDNEDEFKEHLHSLWFGLYGRAGAHDSSSAFEHVFVGEVKRGEFGDEISGFHNWIKFYVEEAAGRLDYQGYIFPRRRNHDMPDAHSQCLSIQFTWNGVKKPVSTTFVGVSPEFEVALYTLCFYGGSEDNHVEVGPYAVNIKCYRHGRDKLGSAFPIVQD